MDLNEKLPNFSSTRRESNEFAKNDHIFLEEGNIMQEPRPPTFYVEFVALQVQGLLSRKEWTKGSGD